MNNEREFERKAFMYYVTDALMIIAENTTHHVGIGGAVDLGKTLNTRYAELLEPSEPMEETDDRPCEEIAQDIFARIRGKQ